MTIDYNKNRLGDVTCNGVIVHLTQDAYADNTGTNGDVAYFAAGVDDAGNEYRVRWETTTEWDALQDAWRADPEKANDGDESEACNWDRYTAEAL